ncbi:MAG: type III secretion system cytoplasmic ring protein SctQ [Ectothiorhodospiraceae bacterium]|nr:type III secretion system cytoplasmic ring protein SctQ [Ectothiorhodospiraceae bacterium]MCH8503881.1 type III secretion system cytoplasmic ring protein SctQ [Ectothiorhodospiraceae bacterium]
MTARREEAVRSRREPRTPTTEISPLHEHLEQIDPAVKNALNRWLADRGPVRFSAEGQLFELHWSPPPVRLVLGAELDIGGDSFLVALNGLTALDPLLAGEPFDRLPLPMRELVIERLLAAFIAVLPAGLADTVDLVAVHWSRKSLPSWECRLGFTLLRPAAGSVSRGILATETPNALLWLHEQLPLPEAPARPGLEELPVPIRAELGRTWLDRVTLSDLAPGDVVWIETARITARGITATLLSPDRSRHWECHVSHHALRVATPAAGHTEKTGERPMTANTEALELPVTFDLGELPFALHELDSIQPGYLIELPQSVTDADIQLRISGSLFARGRLVVVGRRLGVQITHVSGTAD